MPYILVVRVDANTGVHVDTYFGHAMKGFGIMYASSHVVQYPDKRREVAALRGTLGKSHATQDITDQVMAWQINLQVSHVTPTTQRGKCNLTADLRKQQQSLRSPRTSLRSRSGSVLMTVSTIHCNHYTLDSKGYIF